MRNPILSIPQIFSGLKRRVVRSRMVQWINIFLIYLQQILMRRYTKQEKGGTADAPSPKKPDETANSSSKITLHFPSALQHYEQEDNTNPVTIYLRSPSKKSFKLSVAAKISIGDIKALGEERTGIRRDKQMLHLNGKNVTEYSYIRLQPSNIIHIASSDDLLNPEEHITLRVKTLDSFRKNTIENECYTLTAAISVGQLLDRIREEREARWGKSEETEYFYFLESSRLLEREKSFYEQDISKNTELICLIAQHELKTRFSNDTKEEILHDISELLGFEEETEKQPPKVEKAHRPRYPRQERRQEGSEPRERFRTVPNKRINEVPEEPQELEDSAALNKTVSTPNFKKNKEPSLAKTFSSMQTFERPLKTKIKASKSRKQIELLLRLQEKQTNIFELSDEPIKEMVKEDSKKEAEPKEEDANMEIHKPVPSIPKVMPVQERKKIRLEIEKLFDFSDTPEPSPQVKQEEKPKSPPTEQPLPRHDKQREKMRLSMGSRPAFLDQLRLPRNLPTQ